MKRNPASRSSWLMVLALAALLPATGCLRPYRLAGNSSTGSNSTGAYGSNSTGRFGNSTLPSNSTFPSRSGSSSSSDPTIDVEEPLVVAQAGGIDEALGNGDTGSSAASETASAPKADPRDWPYWRGAEYNGISRETGLVDDFDLEAGADGNVSWRREDLGGRGTPVVMNGRLYTLVRAEPETKREGERVVCVDIETGKTVWENRFNVWLSDVPDTRVGWSSVVGDPETGNVYALGVCGFFQCLNGETGERIWSVPMHEKFGLLSTYGGRTNFPIIHEDLVIISAIVIGWGDMAKPAHRFIGFDKRSGEVVWFNGTTPLPYDTTYSAPSLAVFNGQKAIVFGSGDGRVWAIQPRTGVPIWNYDFSMRGLNIAPVVAGNTVFAAHSEENLIREGATSSMGSVVAINGLSKGNANADGELWRVDQLMVGKSSPVVVGDYLYCVDDRAKLYALDVKTGEQVTRKALGTVMRASLLYADGKIYAITAGSSRWYVLKPDGEGGVDILSRGFFPAGEEVNGSPICSHGKVFVQSSGALYCLEDKSKEHGIEPAPEPPAESLVSEDEKPAHVQIVPAELLMQPGRIVTFKARLFNAAGQYLKDTEASFSVDGQGEITDDGTYLASTDEVHAAAIVKAKVGDIEGRARVRIVPSLPWKFDFENLSAPPVTWVGARYRHVVREIDGNKVMVKVTTIPKGTRSRCWFGHPELSDYTIQADVRGAITNEKMPDIGLTAQGYAIDLQGANQKLEIRTWVTQRRMAQAVDFAWKPDTWYTMKLEARVVDDASTPSGKRANLRGKIWPRGDDEPKEWTIEATDESPNLSGSPGLFGNAKDAEIYLDNITVTDNSENAE